MTLLDGSFQSIDGQDPAELLVRLGPTVMVDVSWPADQRPAKADRPEDITRVNLPALIDTGAAESMIDQDVADQLALPLIDKQPFATAAGNQALNIYMAIITIQQLGISEAGRFGAAKMRDNGAPHRVLIGRPLLRHLVMIYDGPRGGLRLAV